MYILVLMKYQKRLQKSKYFIILYFNALTTEVLYYFPCYLQNTAYICTFIFQLTYMDMERNKLI